MRWFARAIVNDALDQLEGEQASIRERYTGRGAGGCFAVVLAAHQVGALCGELVVAALNAAQVDVGTVEPLEDSENVRRLLRSARLDATAEGVIVYFPGWRLV